MNTIAHDQNQPLAIDKVAAFRQSYATAKHIGKIQILFVAISFIITLLSVLLNNESIASLIHTAKTDISHIVLIASLSMTFIDIALLKPFISRHVELGAKIQETFDCDLFHLNWNNSLCERKPPIEKINHLARKYFKRHKSIEHLKNWYSINSTTPAYVAPLVCQYSCLSWDIELREKIVGYTLALSLLLAVSIGISATILNVDMQSILLNFVSVAIPFFTYSFNIYEMNKKTIKNTISVKELIEESIESINPSTDFARLSSTIRQIQDRIYTYRSEAWLIPEWFYMLHRNDFENTMAYSATDIQKAITTKLTQ